MISVCFLKVLKENEHNPFQRPETYLAHLLPEAPESLLLVRAVMNQLLDSGCHLLRVNLFKEPSIHVGQNCDVPLGTILCVIN